MTNETKLKETWKTYFDKLFNVQPHDVGDVLKYYTAEFLVWKLIRTR